MSMDPLLFLSGRSLPGSGGDGSADMLESDDTTRIDIESLGQIENEVV